MNLVVKHRIAGIILVILCVGSVMGTRMVKNVGGAILNEPAKTAGPDNAAAKIVVFSDFQCPYCSQFAPVFKKLHEAYPKDVQIAFKHFPLQMHPSAIPAAEASECAADQGKFWAYHDMLFERQEKWSEIENPAETFKEYAKELGLDTARFNACVDGHEKKNIVASNKNEGKKFMVSGTPTALLNLRKYIVSLDEADIKKAVEAEIKKAGKK